MGRLHLSVVDDGLLVQHIEAGTPAVVKLNIHDPPPHCCDEEVAIGIEEYGPRFGKVCCNQFGGIALCKYRRPILGRKCLGAID